MNPVIKYLFFGLVFIAGIFLLWFFRSIFLFIAISAVLSLIIRPLVDLIKRLKIRSFQIGSGWAALLTVLIVWTIIVVVFWFTIPLIGSELTFLSNVDIPTAIEQVMEMLFQAMEPFRENNAKMVVMLEAQIKEIAVGLFDFGKIGDVFSTMIDFLGGLFIASFSITFITFFFLKEEGLLTSGIMMFIPEHHETGLKHVMQSIRHLLRRYFIGIFLQTILVGLLITLGFYLIGIEISHAVVVGLTSGMLNVIPYLGPLIGAFFGTLVGLIIYLQTPMEIGFLPLLILIVITYTVVHLMDNLIFQPLIFSNSVKAHPLEIFIVILAAGYLSGIVGMFLAIPVYTILRVVGREFFYNYRLVQKLTGRL